VILESDEEMKNMGPERLADEQYRVSCNICGRKFVQDRIDTHMIICMKSK
jgi:hypothetical protein